MCGYEEGLVAVFSPSEFVDGVGTGDDDVGGDCEGC